MSYSSSNPYMLSHGQLFVTPWTVAHLAPLSVGFSRQEYWSGLPFPTPGYLHNPGIILVSLMYSALTGRVFTTVPLGKPLKCHKIFSKRKKKEMKGKIVRMDNNYFEEFKYFGITKTCQMQTHILKCQHTMSLK